MLSLDWIGERIRGGSASRSLKIVWMGVMEHVYEVVGLHCPSCIEKVTNALKSLESVSEVKVDLVSKEARLKMDKHIPTEQLNEAVKSAGNYSLKEKTSPVIVPAVEKLENQSLKPLFIILAYIVLGVLIVAQVSDDYSSHSLMRTFMGGFFVIFSLFKMIDLSGFADGYTSYDILAKRSRAYALTYPFIELGLGVLYLLNSALLFATLITLGVMGIGAIGVGQALLEKRTIQCACLGTVLKLPMTKVTLAEDVLMGGMAGLMLLL